MSMSMYVLSALLVFSTAAFSDTGGEEDWNSNDMKTCSDLTPEEYEHSDLICDPSELKPSESS